LLTKFKLLNEIIIQCTRYDSGKKNQDVKLEGPKVERF